MTDQQRTLSGYKSKITEPGDFENPNDDKPFLTEFDEYVFRLDTFPHVKAFKQQKTTKDGVKITEDVEKAICEFVEAKTGNVVMAFFRVDRLSFSEDDIYRSAIIRFFHRIGHPLQEGVEPDWSNYFVVGMRFRSRVVVGADVKDGNKIPNRKYYIDIPTCRPLLPGDTVGETFVKEPDPKTSTAALANALLLAKGSKDHKEALDKLKMANASSELTLAFFNADVSDQIKYPI